MEIREILKLMWEYEQIKSNLQMLSYNSGAYRESEVEKLVIRGQEIKSILDKELNNTN